MKSAPLSAAPAAAAPESTVIRALRASLILLVALRLVAQFQRSMFAWGIDAGRFCSPIAAAAGWLLIAAPLLPPVGRWLDARLDSLPAPRGLPARLLGCGLVAALVLALPDRTWFVGDFVLRAGIVREPGGFERLFPQAQPLDALLHYRLPHALLAAGLDSDLYARLLGALEAMLLALFAMRLARGLDLRGSAELAVAITAMGGGALALFTGYGKPTIEVALLTLVIGVLALELVRDGRGALGVVIAFALALGFHRSALGLLPGVLVALLLALARGRIRRFEGALAAIVLALTLAWFLPRLWKLFVQFDAPTNFTSLEAEREGGMLRAAFRPLRLLDLANLILLFAPLATAWPWLLPAARRARPIESLLVPAALFAGLLPALLFVTVTQGPFRDWDANAGAGVALALLVAVALAEALRDPASRGLRAACALGVLVPTVLLITSQNDLSRGLARARAFLHEPPARTDAQQLATLDYLGLRELRLEHWAESADAFGALAERAPHPRALIQHGTSALLAGRDAEAERSFRRLVERDSTQALGWFGLWLSARRAGDRETAEVAKRRVLAYPDTGAQMSRILAHLQHYPRLWGLLPAPTLGGAGPSGDTTSAGRSPP